MSGKHGAVFRQDSEWFSPDFPVCGYLTINTHPWQVNSEHQKHRTEVQGRLAERWCFRLIIGKNQLQYRPWYQLSSLFSAFLGECWGSTLKHATTTSLQILTYSFIAVRATRMQLCGVSSRTRRTRIKKMLMLMSQTHPACEIHSSKSNNNINRFCVTIPSFACWLAPWR
jgi:hypothetical protein